MDCRQYGLSANRRLVRPVFSPVGAGIAQVLKFDELLRGAAGVVETEHDTSLKQLPP